MEVVWGVAAMVALWLAVELLEQIVGGVAGVLLAPVVEPVGRVVSPIWTAYVGGLTRLRLALLWIACIPAAAYLLWMTEATAGAVSIAAGLAFIALPTFAVVSTLARRNRARGWRPGTVRR